MIINLGPARYLARTLVCGAIIITGTTSVQAQDHQQWLQQHALNAGKTDSVAGSGKAIYFPAEQLTVEGKGFDDTATTWSRLPQRYRDKVTEGVYNNGLMSAGVAVRFVSNSPALYASWEAPRSFMNHMAPSGSNGLDLYVRRDDKWKYAGTGVPKSTTSTEGLRIWPRQFGISQQENARPGDVSEYLLYLPTYSETPRLEIGITPGSIIAPAPDSYADKKPIVFYGTSISQAACAPRAGLGHIERLRRMLDHPTVNLGFSGSGRLEAVMAEVLAEIPASLYVIETIPNMTDEMVQERTLPFLKKLREMQPDTAILMVGSPNVPLNDSRNALWRKQYEAAATDGVENLHFLDGEGLYGDTDNPTTDGVHPTDLGFYMMARHYEPRLRELLSAE